MAFIQNQIGLVGSGGYIWMSNSGTVVNFSATTSYQEMTSIGTNFTLASISPDFAMSTDGRLKYTGIKTKNFMLDATIAINSTIPHSIAIQFRKNGSAITGAQSYTASLTTNNLMQVPVSLATNDYVSLWLKRSANGTVPIYQITVSASSVNGA